MKILVVLACVAFTSARPEAPLQGYNYAAPRVVSSGSSASSSYQAVAPAVHSQNFGVSSSYQAQAPAPVFQPYQPAVQVHHHTVPVQQYQPAPAQQFHSAPAQQFHSAPAQQFHSGQAQQFQSGQAQQFQSGQAQQFQSSGFGSAVSSGGAQLQQFAPQQTVVQKHIYVHVPPQEPEETRATQVVNQGVPRKHYKIIFIKTPNVQPSAAQIALQQAQQEEKTIVYVLVKKPEDQADFNIPQLAPLPPSKPEVYFIKYKANRGAVGGGALGGAVLGGGSLGGVSLGGGSLGGGVSHVGSSSSSSSSSSGFDVSLGSSAVSGSSSSSSSGNPHTEYGAPGGHQQHGGYH